MPVWMSTDSLPVRLGTRKTGMSARDGQKVGKVNSPIISLGRWTALCLVPLVAFSLAALGSSGTTRSERITFVVTAVIAGAVIWALGVAILKFRRKDG